ncbi:histidine--tRNA ligase [Candidatus Woesearchaeota archaeon CG08_land_8_20_14_0_20_43_7]|nr:MAG: histidine--tRNA ligase [Candidatus Woesearchaeota archaeon CG08_land_8_20_14_0_20_43_7]
MKVQNLRGTRDFYPELMRRLNYIFNIWRKVAIRYGYSEFDGPMLEPAMLWTLKSGAEIPDQMYAFKDKSGNDIAVRPELTPTLARMIAAKQKELPKPLRWFSIPRCWRYEAPQSGRLREFFQFNADLLGSTSMKADAEIIMTVIDIMREFGCDEKEFYIRLGNRKLIQSMLNAAGIPDEKLQEVSRLIDKREKLKPGDFEISLSDAGVSEDSIGKINAMLEIKDIGSIDENTLNDKGKEGLSELRSLLEDLSFYGAMRFVEVDMSIMRGFDYYTSTVFEVFDRSKEMRAIVGGGRYENLVEDFGGDPCPGVGYGLGDVVLCLFLEKLGKLPELNSEVDYYIIAVNEAMSKNAIEVASLMRKKYNVEVELSRKLRSAMDYANSIGAKKVIIVGPKDVEEGNVTIKDMQSGEEQKARIDSLCQ